MAEQGLAEIYCVRQRPLMVLGMAPGLLPGPCQKYYINNW